MAAKESVPTYADTLMDRLAHAPVAQGRSASSSKFKISQSENAIEPELVAVVTNMGRFDRIHPTRASVGESLPAGFSRSCTGFLLCDEILEVPVNQATVKQDTEFLKNHAIVAYFVGGQQSQTSLNNWLAVLQKEVGEWVGVGRTLGRGFFQVLCKHPAATQKVLMLTPHKSRWGTCILQTWTPGFNATRPVGLKVPTWITLKDVTGEFINVAEEIAQGLGEILGRDRRNSTAVDERFCVGLTTGKGYRTKLSVTNESTGEKSIVMVDYCNLPIRCRYCFATTHMIKDCPTANGIQDQSSAPREKSTSASSPKKASSNSMPPIIPPTRAGTRSVEGGGGGPRSAERETGGLRSGETEGGDPEPHTASHRVDDRPALLPLPRVTADGSQTQSASNTSGEDLGVIGSQGPLSSIPRSRSGDRTSDEYRSTPEYEWNGWEKVYRGRKVQGALSTHPFRHSREEWAQIERAAAAEQRRRDLEALRHRHVSPPGPVFGRRSRCLV